MTSAPRPRSASSKPGVAAVDVVRAADGGGPLGDQAGDHQRGAGADVAGLDRRAGEPVDPVDHDVVAVDPGVGAEPGQLLTVRKRASKRFSVIMAAPSATAL